MSTATLPLPHGPGIMHTAEMSTATLPKAVTLPLGKDLPSRPQLSTARAIALIATCTMTMLVNVNGCLFSANIVGH